MEDSLGHKLFEYRLALIQYFLIQDIDKLLLVFFCIMYSLFDLV